MIYVSSELPPFSISSLSLPGDDFVHDGLLLAGCSAQVDAGCFYAFMPHQVGKECYVVEFVEEVLGITMAE